MSDTKCCRDCRWWSGERSRVGKKCENPKRTFRTPIARYKESATRACKMFETINDQFGFKTVANSCMICHEPTKSPNPFYICDKCKAKQDRIEELIDMYGELGKPLSHEHLAEMFLNIIKQKPVSTGYIFDMFDKMDKMGG